MKKIISFFTVALIAASAFGAETDRRTMATQLGGGATPRATASKTQISANLRAAATTVPATAVADAVAQKKQACISNNVGAGNTFVWASKYSNTSNYSSMVEDVENPDNNICFVRVDLKSSDSKINVSDIAPVYYQMGESITCGSWADSDKIKDRILDAKKTARTWGTVAGAVGGAGIGVGAMELFGNKMIGGKVQGQKSMEKNELIKSQLLALKDKDKNQYDKFKTYLGNLKKECESSVWTAAGAPTKPTECTDINYDELLKI